ncbi:NAD-dependent epimerase/dehydratase family protein [Noviherbaspirillum sp.]|uniref:NAD-dependent epimerase/dehydratase family protein n=1 Tax=Noviherbaspirillum sp. TaxID=1926288 RepID=UPI002FDFCBC7
MTVLVTGASGFVGSAVLRRLTGLEIPVVPVLRRRLPANPLYDRAVMVSGLDAGTNWHAALGGVRAIVHAAAHVHVPRSDQGGLRTFRSVNVDGTLRLAREAAAAGVRRFVFISSVKVNGEQTIDGRPFTETDIPAPDDPYGLSKAEAEAALRTVSLQTGMELVIIRPPLVYGPGVKGNFRSMVTAVQRGLPLPLGAVIHNRRSLVAIDNLVDLIIVCLNHKLAANQTFLVSDGDDVSSAMLLKRIAAAFNRTANLLPVPVVLLSTAASVLGKRKVAQRLLGSLQVDIGKSRELLQWTPPISMVEGLRRLAQEEG